MREIVASNGLSQEGNPAGGKVTGTGLFIQWQTGPEPEFGENGTTVEAVVLAALQRLRFLNEAAERKFACRQNSIAITKLEEAIFWLNDRTRERKERGVEGTYEK